MQIHTNKNSVKIMQKKKEKTIKNIMIAFNFE